MAALKAPALRVAGQIRVPGDKSISHRALILAALARGKSRIRHVLDSEDVRSTAQALRALGAAVPPLSGEFLVTGQSSRFLRSPRDPIYCGNSGTTCRLMAGVIAGSGLATVMTGDASLSRRPMRRVAEPLVAMGARVHLPPGGGLPMTLQPGALHTLEWRSAIASAQVKSAVLLAGLIAGVRVHVHEPHRSRDHTERMLAARGVEVLIGETDVDLAAGQVLRPEDIDVPADPSSAAFLAALVILASAGELHLVDVCLNETRTGFLGVLKRMGGDFHFENVHDAGCERVGTIVARPSALHGVAIAPDEVPGLIDELPLFACLAARAAGSSQVLGASELRVKESDRITTVVSNLRAIGVNADELPDGFRVEGSARPLKGRVVTNGDHRIAMSFGVLGALPGNEIEIDDPDCVAVSYPRFWTDLAQVVG